MSITKWISLHFPRYSILDMRKASAAQADETADQFRRMRQYMQQHFAGQPDHFANMAIRSGYYVNVGNHESIMVDTNCGGTLEQ